MESPLLESQALERRNVLTRFLRLDLGEVKRQLAIAVPMIITNVCSYSIVMIAVMFAGHLGELELAAATLANSWAFVSCFAFTIGFSGALETLCGQVYGAKAYRMLGIYLQSSVISTFFSSIIISVFWFYTEPILILLHQNAEISKLASVYLRWLIPGIYAYSWLQCFTRFLQTQSIILPLILCSAIPLAIEIALMYLLVFKTSLGFKGAPLAASVSLWLSILFLALYVKLSKEFKDTWQGFSIESFQCIIPFLKLAIPSAVMVCLEIWSFQILILLAGILRNSEESTSLIAMCVNTEDIAFMITYGFSAAVSTRASNEIGAGNLVQAKNAVSVALKLSFVFAAAIGILLACGHNIWASAFSSSQRIKKDFSSMTPLLVASIVLDAIQGVLAGVARGCGWQHSAAWTNLASFYVIGVPMAILLAFKFDLYTKGLWAGIVCGLFFQALFLFLIVLCSNWSKIPIVPPPADEIVIIDNTQAINSQSSHLNSSE